VKWAQEQKSAAEKIIEQEELDRLGTNKKEAKKVAKNMISFYPILH
jgi:hypothetical protein